MRELIVNKRYPDCLFYNPHSFHHPIKHLVLISALYKNWPSFVDFYRFGEIEIQQEEVSRNTFSTQLRNQKENALKALKQGESLRKVAEETGLSVRTVGIIAAKNNISISLRPYKIYKNLERTIWRKLLIGESARIIAKSYDLSTGAVELILSKHPYLISLRAKIRFFETREKYRKALITIRQKHPDFRRSDIRKLSESMYSWLYRHDKPWLYSHLPAAVSRRVRYKGKF